MLPVVTIADLRPSHIQDLIDLEVAEKLTLEYKRDLPTGQTEQKKEFLYDIAAMANAAGGDIVFGIVDKRGPDGQPTGIAEGVVGLKWENPQKEIATLIQLIRTGVEPRLTGTATQVVSHPDGDVLVIRIPRSWNRPHMTILGHTNKFYSRVESGKYLMSVAEIARMFSEQGELSERIGQWRERRASLAREQRGPIILQSPVIFLFHAIPASALGPLDYRSSWRAPQEQRGIPHHVPPDGSGGISGRYNSDGYLMTNEAGNRAYGYLQFFRSGIVEYADNHCYGPVRQDSPQMIYGQKLEKEMVLCYEDALRRYRREGLNEPLFVGFSLIGIARKTFCATIRSSYTQQPLPIVDDIFQSPEIAVDINEPEEKPFQKTLLPLADIMWQVGGRAGTPFRTSDGIWHPFGEYS